MKIIFDLDGTLTDFNKFVQRNAVSYFKRKYHMSIINSDALEIEDIFDIKNVLMQAGYSLREAEEKERNILNRFWISPRFIKFSLFSRFRPGTRKYFNSLRKDGFDVEIHSSRSKTCEKGFVGLVARMFTRWQCRLNGILLQKEKITFYRNDTEKVESILQACPLIIFEDKPWVIERLTEKGLKVICIETPYNKNIQSGKNVQLVRSFRGEVESKIEKLLGRNSWNCHKKEASSAKFLHNIIWTSSLIQKKFRPIILHPQRRIHNSKTGIIYAPNHRSTLDPLIIESIVQENIHWAALLRFFMGEDSIFNNSKNPILRSVTKYMFHKLEYFPVERIQDNSNANNITSLQNMCLFLNNGYKIGIFAEGTTRRTSGQEFGEFDGTFLRLAEKYDAWIQPVTLLWTELPKTKNRVIVNFGSPFRILDGNIEKAMRHFTKVQKMCLEENIAVIEVMEGVNNK